jgi:small subunit ribosomal protein S4e
MHFKRKTIGKFWPIPRKGTKYVAVPNHNQYESLPLVVVMRDILKIVRTTKELKKLLYEKQVQVNHKFVRETNYPISLFDILSLPTIKKNYKAILSKSKKISLEEVADKEASLKIYKIIDKKVLGDKKIQLNLMHGRNIISKEKAGTGDSIVFDLKENKILKIIPMEKGRTAFIIKGKHAGISGKINDIVERGGKSIAKIVSNEASKDKSLGEAGKDKSLGHQKLNVWIENIIVIE